MERRIHTVGNMVDVPALELTCHHSDDRSIMFLGKMNYDPNIVAVNYFADEIFSELRKGKPQLKFDIIGADPAESVKRLSRREGINVTGFVDSVTPYFQNATVVVAPMLTGAGIQNKIIQAMSYRCCVATTTIGAEGLDIKNGEIAILGTTEEWISGLINLLENPHKRRIMGDKARAYVEKFLSKDSISNQFWDFINDVPRC